MLTTFGAGGTAAGWIIVSVPVAVPPADVALTVIV
jgi:hypothetical protein